MTTFQKNTPCISSHIQEISKKYPHRIAISDEGGQLTYSELIALVDKITGNLLILKGWNQGVSIGVDLEKSSASLALILGIMQAGGVYIPLPYHTPKKRIEEILKIGEAKIFFTDSMDTYKVMKSSEINVVYFPNWINELEERSAVFEPGEMAYIIFTSGSQGIPKGVQVSHRSIEHVAKACYRRFFLEGNLLYCEDQAINISLNSSYSFDVSIVEYLIALMFGNRLIMISEHTRKDLFLMEAFLRDQEVQVLDITPTQMKYYLKTFSKREDFYLPETIINVGEALSQDFVKELFSHKAIKRVINAYGPTEVCVFCHVKVMESYEENPYFNASVGLPLEGVTHYILKEDKSQVEKGGVGNLWIHSSYLSQGYYGDTQGTKKVFIPSSQDPFAQYYNTGDLAVELKNGEIVCLGRNGSQVKIHGQRFELGELETLIRKIEGIEDAKVILNQVKERTRIVAFCQGKAREEDILNSLMESLPKFFLPDQFIFLKQFPINKNGKIDQKALEKSLETPSYYMSRREKVSWDKEDPKSFFLQEISKLLGKEFVGLEDSIDLSEIDSIDIFLLASNIYHQLGKEVHAKEILECQSLRGLCDLIFKEDKHEQKQGSTPSSLPLIPRQNHMFTYEIKAKRKGLLIDKVDPRPIYSVLQKITLSKSFSKEIMEEAFLELIYRHDVLHCKLEKKNQKWFLNKTDKIDFSIEWIKVDGETDFQALKQVKEIDYDKAPLVQIFVVEECSHRQEIYFHFHHLISDPISIYSLIQEWGQLMEELPLSKQEQDYFEFMLEEDNPDQKLVDFWKQYLKGREKGFRFKEKNSECSLCEDSHNKRMISIKEDLYGKIVNYSKSKSISPFTFFLSVLFFLLYETRKRKDILVGIYTHGRPRDKRGLAHMIGLFVSVCPLRIIMEGSSTPNNIIKQTKESLRQVLDHQGLDMYQIFKAMNHEDQMKGELTSLIVNYLEDQEFKVSGTNIVATAQDVGGIPKQKPDLINIHRRSNFFEIDFSFPSSFYSKEDLDLLEKQFLLAIEYFLAN